MSDVNRTAIAVALLAKDENARLLVLSWGLVPADIDEHQLLREWSRVSGVARRQVERLAPALRGHALCLPDRTIDPEASRVIQHVAAEQLRGTQRRPR